MSMPSETHIYECIGLLYEAGDRSNIPIKVFRIYLLSLTNLRSRWQQVGGPLDIQTQMRWIREITLSCGQG